LPSCSKYYRIVQYREKRILEVLELLPQLSPLPVYIPMYMAVLPVMYKALRKIAMLALTDRNLRP
jgi:hypothetical protein